MLVLLFKTLWDRWGGRNGGLASGGPKSRKIEVHIPSLRTLIYSVFPSQNVMPQIIDTTLRFWIYFINNAYVDHSSQEQLDSNSLMNISYHERFSWQNCHTPRLENNRWKSFSNSRMNVLFTNMYRMLCYNQTWNPSWWFCSRTAKLWSNYTLNSKFKQCAKKHF